MEACYNDKEVDIKGFFRGVAFSYRNCYGRYKVHFINSNAI